MTVDDCLREISGVDDPKLFDSHLDALTVLNNTFDGAYRMTGPYSCQYSFSGSSTTQECWYREVDAVLGHQGADRHAMREIDA